MTGAPEEIRTPDPQIRSLVLYPAELRARPMRAIARSVTCAKGAHDIAGVDVESSGQAAARDAGSACAGSAISSSAGTASSGRPSPVTTTRLRPRLLAR